MNNDHFEDDEITWASPEIRSEYEALLGKFLLIYNEIDYLLLKIIESIFHSLGRPDLASSISKEDFGQRAYVLDLLKLTPSNKGIIDISVSELRQLSSDRSIIAHGYMHQNPFDGSYKLIVKGKDKGSGFSALRLSNLIIKATEIHEKLRFALAIYEFDEVSLG